MTNKNKDPNRYCWCKDCNLKMKLRSHSNTPYVITGGKNGTYIYRCKPCDDKYRKPQNDYKQKLIETHAKYKYTLAALQSCADESIFEKIKQLLLEINVPLYSNDFYIIHDFFWPKLED